MKSITLNEDQFLHLVMFAYRCGEQGEGETNRAMVESRETAALTFARQTLRSYLEAEGQPVICPSCATGYHGNCLGTRDLRCLCAMSDHDRSELEEKAKELLWHSKPTR